MTTFSSYYKGQVLIKMFYILFANVKYKYVRTLPHRYKNDNIKYIKNVPKVTQ